jgi:hypothetical protein
VVALAPAAAPRAPTAPQAKGGDGAIAARTPARPRRVGVLIEAAGHLALSDVRARTRLGGAFDVALTIAPLLEITLGFSADQRYSVSDDGRASSLAVWPVEAGVRLVYHRNRWTFGGGPRGGVAILDAEASKPTASARQIEVVGLAGAELIARLRIASWLHVLAGLSLDVLLTQVKFDIPGSVSVGTGRVMAGAVLGLSVSLP